MRNKKVTVTGANVLFFIFVIVFIAFQIILAFIDAILGGTLIKNNMYGMLIVNEYVLILLPVIIFAFVKKLDFKHVFRLNRFGILPALMIIGMSLPAYFAAGMLNTLVVYLLQFIGNVPAQSIPVPQSISELVLGLVVVAFSPALCEEMLNRGIMLKAYENRGSLNAVVITAIFFGIFHFDITNLLGPIFLGLLIGYYAIRTNSIFAAMLAHFMNNAIAEVLSYLFREDNATYDIVRISAQELGGTIIYGIAGLILLFVLLKVFNRITAGSARLKPAISSVKGDLVSIVSHWPVIIILVMYVLMAALYVFSITVMGVIS